ncbi:hypothetical protein N7G274_004230 [Stereocaulon virgatum]|uniref:Uncharacterized protein n=1 Tax=Stereocaulon virgatum TaxID=373712 RepID=A0ABR4ADG2_9LECA
MRRAGRVRRQHNLCIPHVTYEGCNPHTLASVSKRKRERMECIKADVLRPGDLHPHIRKFEDTVLATTTNGPVSTSRDVDQDSIQKTLHKSATERWAGSFVMQLKFFLGLRFDLLLDDLASDVPFLPSAITLSTLLDIRN